MNHGRVYFPQLRCAAKRYPISLPHHLTGDGCGQAVRTAHKKREIADVQMRKKGKRHLLKKGIMALLFLAAVFGSQEAEAVLAAEPAVSAEEYLTETGMSSQEIEILDSDIRQFIAGDLRDSGVENWKVDSDILALTKTSSQQYTVVFYINVFAFQGDSEHRVYAVYESSTGITPVGNDSLFLRLGDRFSPYEYGGRVWYKKVGDGNWTQGGGLTADYRTAGGGTFTGRQLGDFQQKMLVKGCVCCYAGEGTGEDNQVTVEYTYCPAKESNDTWLYIMIVAVTVVVVLILRRRE